MREEKFRIYPNDNEYSRMMQSLIRLGDNLIVRGGYIDGVDGVLCRVLSARERKPEIIHI